MSRTEAGGAANEADRRAGDAAVDVSVVVVTWNGRDRLERCLQALRDDPSGGRREVIVVDNASTDGLPALVRERFPAVRLVELRRNAGFAAANNVGAVRAHGRYLLLLNSDAYVRPGAVGALVACLDTHPEAAVAGPQLRFPDGRLQPSGRPLPTLYTALRALLPFAPGELQPRDYDQPAEVDEVSAAAMLVRRSALAPGEPLFDPAFHFFGEDVDLCWRLRERGWRTRYWPGAVVEHEWGASRAGLSHAGTAFLAQRGYLRLIERHRPPAEGALLHAALYPITLAKIAAWALAALRGGQLGQIPAIVALARRELAWLRRRGRPAPTGADRRVTLVTGSWPPERCGVGDYTATLARSLQAAGARVSIVGPNSPSPRWGGAWGVRSLPHRLRAVLRTRPDVVHVQYPTVGYGRGVAPNLLPWLVRLVRPSLPVVTTLHEFTSYRLPGRLRAVVGALGSAAVVTPDPANQIALRRWLPAWLAPVEIPAGASIEPTGTLDPARRREVRASAGAGDDDCLAVYFGFVSRSKGIETLLRAAAAAQRRLRETAGPALRLLLLAEPAAHDPAEAAVVEAVVRLWRELGGEAVATWTGNLPVEGVSDYLAAADLAVLPFADGASARRTTLLAALAHGLPTISTRGPGATDPAWAAALCLVPPNDVEALAAALADLARSPERRSALAAGARRLAERFRWPAIAGRHFALYQSLGAGQGGGG